MMKNANELNILNFNFSKDKLIHDYDLEYENNATFKKIASSLDLPKDTLIKETSKIIESSIEVDRCKKCKHLFECKNNVEGYVYYPINNNGIIEFCYIPCKYKKEMDKKTSYLNNIYSYSLPNDIKMASMKDINLDDKNRFEVITWIKKYIDDYLNGIKRKGLYLTGNFGSGKTYLLSAMLNELAKNGHKVAIVYYPEFLRSLKESMYDSEDFNMKFNRVKNSELLLIDDIGAEALTPWARDEVLGTILQYRMNNDLKTFFTSNLTIKELEQHLSITKNSIDVLKARRIIEIIKQLSIELPLIAENQRK